jgi:hypothetical protein
MTITVDEYFMGRDESHAAELTDELRANAAETVRRYNEIAAIYERSTGNKAPRGVTSGWRPKSINDATPGAAKRSNHLICKAIDVDDNGPFDRWCFWNPARLAEVGLWQEHPGWTDGWCHLQIVPPPGGAKYRTFIPSTNEPMTTIYGRENVIYEV